MTMSQPRFGGPMPALLDIPRVAWELSISPRTVLRRIENGVLKSVKDCGRRLVTKEDFMDYINRLK